jgi:hypothetical protein
MKLLLKFFSNPDTKAYLRGLAEELQENTNAIRLELNRFTDAGLLVPQQQGNVIWYKANRANPFFGMLQRIVRKYMGLEDIIESVVHKIGDLEAALLVGDYARGIDSGTIELLLVANNLDEDYVARLHSRGEALSGRRIQLHTCSPGALPNFLQALPGSKDALLLYQRKEEITPNSNS